VINDTILRLRPRLLQILKGFSDQNAAAGTRAVSRERPERHAFPVPELVLFALRDVMGFAWTGHGEKVRWTIYCAFENYPISLSLTKFGFGITYPTSIGVDRARRLRRQLSRAVRAVEEVIQRLSLDEMQQGNVGLANRYHEFDQRYRFLRGTALEKYQEPDPPPTPIVSPQGKVIGSQGVIMQNIRFASYLCIAMVDAFFSRLEHLLILLLPFSAFDPGNGALVKLIKDGWEAKYRALFDIAADKHAKKLYDALKALREGVRNPYAHGGFEKGWWSLFFPLPNVGMIPASLTRIVDSVQFQFIPLLCPNIGPRLCSLTK
jgi:hypothetical protein